MSAYPELGKKVIARIHGQDVDAIVLESKSGIYSTCRIKTAVYSPLHGRVLTSEQTIAADKLKNRYTHCEALDGPVESEAVS